MFSRYQLDGNPDFMGGWIIDPAVCDGLIDYYENAPNKEPGYVYLSDGSLVVRPESKISTETGFYFNATDPRLAAYMDSLVMCVDDYKMQYEALDKHVTRWGFTEIINIQRYEPSEGYFKWHTERFSNANVDRLLVFMTYLNDVTDGGQTEWMYQKLSVQPKKGLTVIWPADWMFLHRGVTSPTQQKTIVTGWLSFMR